MNGFVECDGKLQAAAFSSGHILDRHGSGIVVGDRSRCRVAVGHQRVAGIKSNCEGFAPLQHRIVQCVDRELLRLARRPYEPHRLSTVVVVRGAGQRYPASRTAAGKGNVDIERTLNRLVQTDRELQPIAFHHRHIFDRHGRIIVIRDRSRRRVTVRDQRVAGSQLNGKRLARFQHRIIERADCELLRLARRTRKVQYHRAVVIILGSNQGRCATGRGHVAVGNFNIQAILHSPVQCDGEQQPTAFGGRHVFDRDCRGVIIGDPADRRIAVGHQGISGRQVNPKCFRAFQHDIIKRADGELLCLACRPREVQCHRAVVVIFRSD